MESLCGCRIPDGHPLFVLYKENAAISKKAAALRDGIDFSDDVDKIEAALDELSNISSHYEKQSRCLYPVLRSKDNAPRELSEMADGDHNIMRELRFLAVDDELSLEDWEERLLKLSADIREMLGKENNVLFPYLSQNLSEEDWIQIYFLFRDIKPCFIDAYPIWQRAEHPDAPRCACEL